MGLEWKVIIIPIKIQISGDVHAVLKALEEIGCQLRYLLKILFVFLGIC